MKKIGKLPKEQKLLPKKKKLQFSKRLQAADGKLSSDHATRSPCTIQSTFRFTAIELMDDDSDHEDQQSTCETSPSNSSAFRSV